MRFQASKWVEFDAAHRVPAHNSKCKNLHGHRYRVEALVEGPLQSQGSETGMVVDFGNIKARLAEVAHDKMDHATMLWIRDPVAQILVPKDWLTQAAAAMAQGEPDVSVSPAHVGKVVLLPCVPTAEELARHFFAQLTTKLAQDYHGVVRLARVTVRETPTSLARFEG